MAAALVADASVAAAWCFPDERTDFTDAVLDALTSGSMEVLVPHLWAYEVRNSVLMGVRRGRISVAHGLATHGTCPRTESFWRNKDTAEG